MKRAQPRPPGPRDRPTSNNFDQDRGIQDNNGRLSIMVVQDESDAGIRSVSSASTIVTDNNLEYEWEELANRNGW